MKQISKYPRLLDSLSGLIFEKKSTILLVLLIYINVMQSELTSTTCVTIHETNT